MIHARTARWLALAATLLGAKLAWGQTGAGWKHHHTSGAFRVETRSVEGSPYEEVRVITRSPAPLSALCEAVWGKNVPAVGMFKKRVVIRESETERLTYEQISVPLAGDRDCVLLVELVASASTGRCEVRFETRTDPGYPERADHVRLTTVHGSWTLEPARDGTVVVTYVVYAEPGGAVPALFARRGQREAATDSMKSVLGRVLP